MDVSNLNKKRISEFLSEGERFDNRKTNEFRKISIETGFSKNAEGSARVKIGNTDVIVGIKMDISEPYPDSEDKGTMMTTAELLPLASPKFETGPPKFEAIELARIVDRGIRESGFIDFKKLCIKEGEKVWSVYIDIYPINDDGNLIDAAALASVTALLNAKMPKFDEKTEKIKYGELTNKSLPLTDYIPITITTYKIGKSYLIDPNSEEEKTSEARLSFAFSDNKKISIHAAQKGGEGSFEINEVNNIIDFAKENFEKIYPQILKQIKK